MVMQVRFVARVLLLAACVLSIVAQANPCSWATGYFHQVTRLRGRVVGAKLGPLQYAGWLRHSFVRKQAKLTLYSYRWPIKAWGEMPVVKMVATDGHGKFDFGALEEGHYTLVVDDAELRTDWFDVEIKSLRQQTESVTIDVSPHFPDCKGGHEFIVNTK